VATRAVLFDVGGPLDLEIRHEQLVERDMLRALHAAGIPATQQDLELASEAAVSTFAPNAYAAMIWRLCGGRAQLAANVTAAFASPDASAARSDERGGLELRPGIPDLLRDLRDRGLLLGLAANQPARCLADLDRLGLGGLFGHREVSGHHGYHKPDVRLFLRACQDLGVLPEECIMVGDRIDNDIVPARLLGMQTVLLRTGRHIAQRPRSAHDVPTREVRDVAELRAALFELAPGEAG
jgi:HAD superfamily hydrolase (TIGR01509 family)